MTLSRTLLIKLAAAGTVAAGALFAGAAAHANPNFSIGIDLPGVVIGQPAPPVYYEPAPVYSRPAPTYYQPAPVYSAPAPIYYDRDSRWEERRAERRAERWEERRAERAEWRRRQWERENYRRHYEGRD
ncbi:hypothetical protein [Variovorax boronicumulans]|uniref:hypothetical protein n=1 Tax=Variovorax boronicumulans TaxID=436515 RepID=UPI003399FA24